MDPDGDLGLSTVAHGVDPVEADRVVAGFTLLSDLSRRLDDDADKNPQCWIGTGNHERPSATHFQPVDSGAQPFGGKPSLGGIFTSSAGKVEVGMWAVHLLFRGDDQSFRPPWDAWMLRPAEQARVLVIRSATSWCEVPSRWPKSTARGLDLDWSRLALEYDAIRVTLMCVAACDGVVFRIGDRLTVPAHWSVETTIWLCWCFEAAEGPRNVLPG